MNYICRLCLTADHHTMNPIYKECDLSIKIRSCLSLEIDHYELLPNKICLPCTNKVEDMLKYQETVMQNNTILLSYYNKGVASLNKFYSELLVKKETDSNIEQVKAFEFTTNYANIDIKKENSDNDLFAHDSHNDISDDDINLSVFKKENKIEHVKTEHTHNTKENVEKKNNERLKPKNKIKKKSERKHSPYSVSFVDETVAVDSNKESVTVGEEIFRCVQCFSILKSYYDLLNHYNTEHRLSKDEEAEKEAENSFSSVPSDNGAVVYKCSKCDKVYDEKRGIKRHVLIHIEDSPFLCKLCGRTYKTAYDIARHGKVHSGFKLTCKYECGYTSPYLGAIREHEMRHRREFKYRCEVCNKGFQVKSWYDQHQNVHRGLKPFICDICGVAFHMDRYLTAHRSVVHQVSSSGKRFLCTECPDTFSSKKALTAHLQDDHEIKASYLCDKCGKEFAKREWLKQHLNMHGGIKPYTCDICKRSYAKKYTLQEHMRTHTGVKNDRRRSKQVCGKCGKSYEHRSTLQRHITRHHSGPGPQKCVKCQEAFATVRTLKSHQKLCYKT